MRIPTSVIVMSLLTAAPFAMAVRDTVNGKDKPVIDDWDEESISSERERELLAEYEAERARELEERERQSRANIGRLDRLFGAGTAQMSPYLDGVAIGPLTSYDALDLANERFEREMSDGFAVVHFDRDAKRLRSVTVTVVDNRQYDGDGDVVDLCDTLAEKLGTVWGPSTGGVWLNPATLERATLESTECALTFDRAQSPTDGVAAIPFTAPGKPAQQTLESLETKLGFVFDHYDDDGAAWSMPGVGFGRGPTSYEVYVDNGKIVGLRVSLDTDFDTRVAIRDAMSAKLESKPVYDEDAETWIWKKAKTSLTSYAGSSRVVILVGKDPYE